MPKSEVGASCSPRSHRSEAAYQAIRYSQASEEQFLDLMRKAATEAATEAETEQVTWRGLLKQEGCLPAEEELRDLEFEELDRRAAEVLEKR